MKAVYPQVLVDAWPDGCVEERAWVEVTKETDTKNKAAEYLAVGFPREDGEGDYHASGERVFQRPQGLKVETGGYYDFEDGDLGSPCEECDGAEDGCAYCYGTGKEGTLYDADEGPWTSCGPEGEDAREFWIIAVVGL